MQGGSLDPNLPDQGTSLNQVREIEKVHNDLNNRHVGEPEELGGVLKEASM